MHVIQDEHERLGRGDALEQLAQRAVGAVALVRKRRLAGASEAGQGGQHPRELGADLVLQRLKPPRVESRNVLV